MTKSLVQSAYYSQSKQNHKPIPRNDRFEERYSAIEMYCKKIRKKCLHWAEYIFRFELNSVLLKIFSVCWGVSLSFDVYPAHLKSIIKSYMIHNYHYHDYCSLYMYKYVWLWLMRQAVHLIRSINYEETRNTLAYTYLWWSLPSSSISIRVIQFLCSLCFVFFSTKCHKLLSTP